MDQCQDCRHYQQVPADNKYEPRGECRIRAPLLTIGVRSGPSRWPVVFAGDWCSEFKERPKDS